MDLIIVMEIPISVILAAISAIIQHIITRTVSVGAGLRCISAARGAAVVVTTSPVSRYSVLNVHAPWR
jgi:hypothetical protein